jgi:hypothetical protein
MEKQNLPNATAVLVLGICSVVLGCFFVGIICGIIGIVLSMQGRKLYKQDPTIYEGWGSLNAGFIMSIIGVCIWGLYYVYVLIIGASALSILSSLHQ